MVNMKAILATSAALAAMLGSTYLPAQQIQGEALAKARAFADQALRNYATAAVTQENAARLGFKSVGEARTAQLGEPIPILFVGLKDLKAFRPGTKVGSMLRDMRTLWFPVLVGGEVRAELEISEVGGKWLAGEFGRPATAKGVSGVHHKLTKILESAHAQGGAPPVLVRIPVLHAQLFYQSGPEGDFLIPAQAGGLPSDIEVGKAYPAEALLARLAKMAQKMRPDTVD